MKKIKLFVLSTTVLFFGQIQAGFNFSNQNSTVHVGSQSCFIVNKEITGMNGTLYLDDYDPDRIMGANSIIFQRGVLENGYAGTVISGKYTPFGNPGHDKVELQGTSSIPHWMISQAGALVPMVTIQGDENSIGGRPVFNEQIIFDGDPNTKLNIEIQNKLNKNIELNNGTLVLDDDLSLADDVMIQGPGTIDFNAKTLYLASYQTSWAENLLLKDARDIQFFTKQNLTGIWTFDGIGLINGHGAVLDVTGGGRIVVASNSQLSINDTVIKGVGDLAGLGCFVFTDESSKIIFSNVTVELDSSYSTTIGNIYIDGTSTVIVKDHIWLFDQQGSLSVDGVTLWTDRAGEIVDNALGIAFGVPESDHYSSIESGTIKLVVGSQSIDALSSLVVANSNAIVYLQNSTDDRDHLFPGETLTFNVDQTLDGDGKNVVFSHWDQPQFIVAPGVTITLQNIELMRINEKTFQMGAGAKIKIGENVLFELSEDVAWGPEQIEVIGENNIFTIRGVGGRKRLTFHCTCHNKNLALILGANSLLLQNIELSGLHFCDGSRSWRNRDFILTGGIILGGDSIVNVDYSSPMNFVAQSNNNELRLRKNNVALRGSLSFGNLPENDLHLKFLLEDEESVIPRVRFENAFALVTSQKGWANLIFDDPYVQVYNETENSFVLSDRALLGGYRLEILHNPIKQISRNIVLMPGLEITTDLDNAIEQEFFRSLWNATSRIREEGTPDIKIIRDSQKQQDGRIKRDENNTLVVEDARSTTDDPLELKGGSPGRNNSQRDQIVQTVRHENYDITYDPLNSRRWSSIDSDFTINYNTIKLSRAKNNIWLKKGTITDFGVSHDEPLVVTMVDGSTLQQGKSNTTLKYCDELRIQGTGNKVIISNTFTINGKILFDKNADVTFEFDPDRSTNGATPTVVFACVYEPALTIPKGSRFKFKGKGTVLFQDGSTIHLDDSEFTLQDSAELSLASNATLYMTGRGKVLVDNKARLCVAAGQHLIIGLDESDSIELLVDRQGEISVDGTMSFQLATYAIDVLRQGRTVIKNGGLLEIGGILTRFTLQSGGILQVDRNSLLQMSEQTAPFTWDNSDGQFRAGGLLGFQASGFSGQIQDINIGPVQLAPESFVTLFINQKPDFTTAALFTDESGNRKIRTKDGIIVDLLESDQITGENVATGAIMLVNDGEPFAITAQGERI